MSEFNICHNPKCPAPIALGRKFCSVKCQTSMPRNSRGWSDDKKGKKHPNMKKAAEKRHEEPGFTDKVTAGMVDHQKNRKAD